MFTSGDVRVLRSPVNSANGWRVVRGTGIFVEDVMSPDRFAELHEEWQQSLFDRWEAECDRDDDDDTDPTIDDRRVEYNPE